MDMEHMKDFVDYWFFRVHQRILDTLNLSLINQGEDHDDALKTELEKMEQIGFLDVASNFCLMSFVYSVAFSQLQGSSLPIQCILLYEAIANSTLSLWSNKRSTIPIEELIRILSDIASTIHGNFASALQNHTNDPRFRVPIALALGKITYFWSQNDFDNFCYEFIKEQDECKSLVPLGAYTLITCVNDLVNYPSDEILFNVLDCLIITAGRHKWTIVCPFLFDQITLALKKFRNDIIPLWVNDLLSRSSIHNIQTISALCHLIEGKPHEFEKIKWLNQLSCSMLQSLSILDNEINEFSIDQLLVKIAFSNHRLLPISPTILKKFLPG
ncbi:unnamed protein product [Rotaria sp. Silwood2]|nr:unnamed protein product [Rotaria sp. Silwood2]